MAYSIQPKTRITSEELTAVAADYGIAPFDYLHGDLVGYQARVLEAMRTDAAYVKVSAHRRAQRRAQAARAELTAAELVLEALEADHE